MVYLDKLCSFHYCDVITGAIASHITSLTFDYSNVYSDADERKHQSSASLAFVRGPVNSPHKSPVTRKMFPFDDVIMLLLIMSFSDMIATCSHPPNERVDCGWRGVTASQCISRGCCFDSSLRGVHWCFYKQGVFYVVLHECTHSYTKTMTSYEYCGVSNHRELVPFFNSLASVK